MKALEILYKIDTEYKYASLNTDSCVRSSYVDEAIAESESLENKFKVEQENNLSSEIAKTETILRLKKYIEALENRSCDGCKYHLGDNGNYPFAPCDKCSRFYSDCWESKC